MEVAILIVFLFVDLLSFDILHEQVGIDATQPIISMATEQICEAGNGTYTKWGVDAGCADFVRPKPE